MRLSYRRSVPFIDQSSRHHPSYRYPFLISSCVASGLMLKESYNFVSATIVVIACSPGVSIGSLAVHLLGANHTTPPTVPNVDTASGGRSLCQQLIPTLLEIIVSR